MVPFENWFENWPMPFSRMMDEFFGMSRGENMIWGPNVDITETPDSYEIHAELPGVKQDDVKINLNNNVLTISGEKRQEIKEGGDNRDNPLRIERSYGRFERSFALPTSVNPDAVKASYEDGVLTIMLPKAEGSKSRPIPIESKGHTKSDSESRRR
jgi:HSP20 family protein